MEENKLKGLNINPTNHLFKMMLKSCQDELELNPELVILYDLESGMPYTATKEERDYIASFFESFKPKNINLNYGGIIIFGTGGQIDKSSNQNFSDFFE